MAIDRHSVVYRDPTDEQDVLSATPGRQDGAVHGTISVTRGAKFQGDISNGGTTQSVCVRVGDELTVLAKLGDKLRNIGGQEPDERTVVSTIANVKHFASQTGLTPRQLRELLAYFTTAPVNR